MAENEPDAYLWDEFEALERRKTSEILEQAEEADRHGIPGTYVLFRDGEPIYTGGADDLYKRIVRDLALTNHPMWKSDLARRAAQHLNIALSLDIKEGKYQLTSDDEGAIRAWLDDCVVAVRADWRREPESVATNLRKQRPLLLQRDQFDIHSQSATADARILNEYEQKRIWIDIPAVAIGIVLSSLIGARLMYPFWFTDATYAYPFLGGESIFQFVVGIFVAPWLVIPLYVWLVGSKKWPLARTTPILALAVPAVLIVGWLVALKPAHDRQRDSFDAFAAYFHRIPDSKLGTPLFVDQNDLDKSLTTVCADLGRQDGTDFICAETDLHKPARKRVVGGFQTRTIHVLNDVDDGYTGSERIVMYEAHDCWGLSSECE